MTSSPQPVALITAGAAGIGAVLAHAFIESGYAVHVCDRDAKALEAFLAATPGASGSLADVADPVAVAAMFEDLERAHGRLDVLVNNAGIAGPTARIEDTTVEDWDHTIAVDLNSVFYVTRHAVPLLRNAGGGSIVNMSSNAGFFGFPYRLPYTASKWALIGITKTLAMELGPAQIRVNALCPGSVNGDRIDGVIQRDAQQQGVEVETIRKLYARQSSLRTFVDPEAIAAMAVFLASAAGAKISGQAIAIDGHTESLSNTSD